MATEIRVPTLGESITEATVVKWFKAPGDAVAQDEPLLELETDKVTLEVNAPAAGTLTEIRVPEGTDVEVGNVLGTIEEGAAAAPSPPKTKPALAPVPEPAPAAPVAETAAELPPISPAVRALIAEHALDPAAIPATGKGGRLLKGDVLAYLESAAPEPAPEPEPAPVAPAPRPSGEREASSEREERVPMTRLRRRIAERLKEAQNTAAMLTTFNEVDMSALLAARTRHKAAFEKSHGVRLGLMSFFVKAACAALRDFPTVNAEIDGNDIVYRNYYDIGVAVGSGQGLVVPVLRDADRMSFAEIEAKIAELGRRASDGSLTIEDLTGGTFTISNGGVYGSLLSTPILNPPQSGILGMHKTQDRPVAVDGEIVIRPMMYLAMSYDHRVVDGREAVGFLVRIKECIDDPQRLLLDS
ncbi:MAG: 2-oxoglutarate dehydrogenase complex dihydrolipoyllysine-residue succinyltransferase [Alphaproteobacteria bacterium]